MDPVPVQMPKSQPLKRSHDGGVVVGVAVPVQMPKSQPLKQLRGLRGPAGLGTSSDAKEPTTETMDAGRT